MEFTTGLMSLDTALNEMLSRVTPLTAQKRCHWFSVLDVFWRAMSFRRWMSQGLITPQWTVTRYVWPISPPDNRCPLPGSRLPVSLTMASGPLAPASAL